MTIRTVDRGVPWARAQPIRCTGRRFADRRSRRCPAAPPTGARTCATRTGSTGPGRTGGWCSSIEPDGGGDRRSRGRPGCSSARRRHRSVDAPPPGRCCSARSTASITGRSAAGARRPEGSGSSGERRAAPAALGHRRRPAHHRGGDAGLARSGAVLPALRTRRASPNLAGWARSCPNGHQEFPRTDPAVIVLVHDGDGQDAAGPPADVAAGRYSVLAGFTEAGSRWRRRSSGRSARRSGSRSPRSAISAPSRGRSRGR